MSSFAPTTHRETRFRIETNVYYYLLFSDRFIAYFLGFLIASKSVLWYISGH